MKKARISLRSSPEEKLKFEELKRMTLSNKERNKFLQALSHPLNPSKRLKQAMKQYRKSLGNP